MFGEIEAEIMLEREEVVSDCSGNWGLEVVEEEDLVDTKRTRVAQAPSSLWVVVGRGMLVM